MADANREQRAFWNDQAGAGWVAHQEQLDAQIHAHGLLAMEALAPRPGERVLDVGCGCGDTTLELARRVAPRGSATGVDLSEVMLARARERAAAAGVANVSFRHADAQTAAFGDGLFDGVFSRFGVMFFDAPERAFQNLAKALRPGGRLAFVCWQAPAENPWVTVPMAAVAPLLTLPPAPPPGSPGMFAFGDANRVKQILEAAGFTEIAVAAKHVMMRPGGSGLESAVEVFLEIGPVAGALREAGADAALRERVREAVTQAFRPHVVGSVVELDSAVYVATARRPR